MTACECSAEFGPCEQHADILVVRQGAAVRSGEELTLLLVEDLIDCGVKLSDDDRSEYDRLNTALIRDQHTGIASFPDEGEGDYYDSEAAQELADRVESNADGLWIRHDDGYVISRPHPDCPLLESA